MEQRREEGKTVSIVTLTCFLLDTMPQAQFESAKLFLQGMGYKTRQELYDLPIDFSNTEAQDNIEKF